MFHPFGNETVSPPAQWHPEPKHRGTWSVLSSCLLTMFLCIWTAVHLNLPEHKKEHEQRLRKVGWLVLGLLAPEVVAWNAFEQRREVKKLTREMRELYRRQHGAEVEYVKERPWYHSIASWWRISRRAEWLKRGWHKIKVFFLCEAEDLALPPTGEWPTSKDKDAAEAFWTDLHSWYVIMGGFAFDTTSAPKPFLPGSRERIVLTARGVLELAERRPELLPKLSQGDIDDKSKSDGLAKLITCWQATWFCVQCICRLAQGLSISLLELNVFGHAICALLIYMLWWAKPKDISEPTRIVGEESCAVAALMYNFSRIGCLPLFDSQWRRTQNIGGAFRPYHQVYNRENTSTHYRRYSPNAESMSYYRIRDLMKPSGLRIADSYWYLDFVSENTYSMYIAVDAITANRLSLIRQLPQEQKYWDPSRSGGTLVHYRSKDWVIDIDFLDWIDGSKWQYLVGITMACALYGGLHTTAWHAAFPSSVEQLLWRTSSATVTSSGFGCILPVGLVWVLIVLPDDGKKLWFQLLENGTLFVICVYLFSASVWYCFCRSFLVVESFINVAHLSASDLGLPTWSSYVPHIS